VKTKGSSRLLSQETQAKVLAYLKDGNYIETACRAAGIASRTFRSWMEHGDDPTYDNAPVYRNFREKALQALAVAEAALLSDARKGSREAIPIMERRWPDRWGRKERADVNVTTTVNIKAEDLTDDELAAIVAGRGGLRTIKAPPVTPTLN
jgi:hypothetical protein